MTIDRKTFVWSMVLLAGMTSTAGAQVIGNAPGVGWFDDEQGSAGDPEPAELPDSVVFSARGDSSATLFSWNGEKNPTDLGGPLVTDRPDFTEASSTVGQGVLQLEIGYTYTCDNDGTTQTLSHSYPETLLRYGMLANWLEFRLASNFASERTGRLTSTGSEDLYLGFKIGLTPQHDWLPEAALIPQMTVPTGSGFLSSNKVLPGANLVYSWDITERLSTAGSTQFNSALDDATSSQYAQWAQSWTFGYALTDQLGMYTEWYAFFPHGADSTTEEHYFNGGFTRTVGHNVQWDIRGGLGLNEVADDYFVGTGLSVRFR